MDYNKYIDHTLLKAFATKEDILNLCNEAKEYNFKSVCVNPDFVSYAKELLKGSDVLVCTVIGFPLGANTTKVKVFEAHDAISNGADEIDMVINISKAKEHDYNYIYEEIKAVKNHISDHTLKVIIETCYLTEEEIKEVSLIVKKANANFVKTSTGFGTGGAKESDIKLIKSVVGDFDIKASGGIKTKEDFLKMIDAGATRIGTSNGKNLV
ncbi:MAG: deoxyribose-phosphate aldolase [bacterium]|nr:deoxyribose-phosphate aldolase [bacterium]